MYIRQGHLPVAFLLLYGGDKVEIMQTMTYVAEHGEDSGKNFCITKMPVMKAEKWAAKALLAIMHGNPEIPEEAASMGILGLLQIGLSGLMKCKWEDVEPLLDEMLDYVEIIPDVSKPQVKRRLFDGDVQDVRTIIGIRKAIWEFNTSFLSEGATQKPEVARRTRK